MKHIVFVGNCQLQSVANLYSRFVEPDSGYSAWYLPSYENLTAEGRKLIEGARVLVQQVMDLEPKLDLGDVSLTADKVLIPLVSGGFLWPFGGEPHVRNEASWFLPSGPYDAELGDSYLNRLISKGTTSQKALESYYELDVNKVRNLDRILELFIDRQKRRDQICGFSIGELIEARFREMRLFLTPYHPDRLIALSLAEQTFLKLGASQDAILRMWRETRETPFPKNECPIHPAVQNHFRLRWTNEYSRYRFHEEGRFNFREFAARYIEYQWNWELLEGIAIARTDPERAPPLLESGLAASPNSAEGHYEHGELLLRTARYDQAEQAFRRAVELDPMNPRHQRGLSQALGRLERLKEAIQLATLSVDLAPYDFHCLSGLAHLFLRVGNISGAEEMACRALAIQPKDSHALNLLAEIRARHQPTPASRPIGPDVIENQSSEPAMHVRAGHVLASQGRYAEAAAEIDKAIELEPNQLGHIILRNHLLIETGDISLSELPIRASISAHPGVARLYEQLGSALLKSGRTEEAVRVLQHCITADPNSSGGHATLSHALWRAGDTNRAIAEIRRAIELEENVSHYFIHLGNLLLRQEDRHGAATAFKAAVQLAPDDRVARERLALVEALA